jgi:hypothetical protein
MNKETEIKIRCTKEFKEYVKMISEKMNLTSSSLITNCVFNSTQFNENIKDLPIVIDFKKRGLDFEKIIFNEKKQEFRKLKRKEFKENMSKFFMMVNIRKNLFSFVLSDLDFSDLTLYLNDCLSLMETYEHNEKTKVFITDLLNMNEEQLRYFVINDNNFNKVYEKIENVRVRIKHAKLTKNISYEKIEVKKNGE